MSQVTRGRVIEESDLSEYRFPCGIRCNAEREPDFPNTASLGRRTNGRSKSARRIIRLDGIQLRRISNPRHESGYAQYGGSTRSELNVLGKVASNLPRVS